MQNWITESEHKEAMQYAKEIFADWPIDYSDMEDIWVGVTIGQKEFDLNVWFDSEAVSWTVNIHPTKINDSGQRWIRIFSPPSSRMNAVAGSIPGSGVTCLNFTSFPFRESRSL